MGQFNINATIPFGASLRVGYKIKLSSDNFTYHNHYPTYNELPYVITDIPAGNYQMELTTICPNCSGAIYADPVLVDVAVA